MCNETAAKETKQTEVCNKGKLESGEKTQRHLNLRWQGNVYINTCERWKI